MDRSNEVIKQLNRLANDRGLPPNARSKVRGAAQHIKELQNELQQIRGLDFKSKEH